MCQPERFITLRLALSVVVCLTAVACGGRHHVKVAPPDAARGESVRAGTTPPADSLETFMAKVRKVSEEARPVGILSTPEAADPRLAEALLHAIGRPQPATYRAVATEYRRLGLFDRAHEYLAKALLLDPTDAATHDAAARLWRDSGFPQLGLSDAYRAVYYAPGSAVARNTLGTVLQALGHRALAREEYQRAVKLDPFAAFALNNLCYVWTLEGETSRAIPACERALTIQPDLTAARNNLGLAHAVAGDPSQAREAFAAAGDPAAAQFNTGMIHLAHRQYGSAVKAFQAAHALRPSRKALARANQAMAAAKASTEE